MKTTPILMLLWITLMISSCITIRSRKVDDGTKSLTTEDRAKIVPFDLNSIYKKKDYSAASEIVFQIITASDLKTIINTKPYTWVLICASWCPISESALNKYSDLTNRISTDSLALIIISQDLNIKILQKEIFKSKYSYTPYLMMSEKYGTDEVSKQEKFISDFDKTIPINYFTSGGVPKNLLFNQKQELLYLAGGSVITCDTIKKYTNLNCGQIQ